MKKDINKKNKRGFSLIEVLIALFILSFGVSAVFVLMSSSIKDAQTSKNQTIAAQLAQEGIELVKNFKDNAATPATFSTELAIGGVDFRADYSSTYVLFKQSPTSFPGPVNKKLYLDSGFYTHTASSTSTDTKFLRKIAVSVDAVSKNATITVTISWNGTDFPAETAADPCNITKKCLKIVSILTN